MAALFNSSSNAYHSNSTGNMANGNISISSTENIAGIAVRLLVNLIGTIANILLLYACHRRKPCFTASGILIMELAASWLIQCALYYPVYNMAKIATILGYNVGKGYCLPVLSVQVFFITFTAVIEAGVAWNRLVAVWLPARYRALCSRKMTLLMSLVAMAIGLAYAFSVGYRVGLLVISIGDNTTCMFVPANAWGAQLASVVAAGPIAFPGVCYLLLFGKVMQLKRRATSEAMGQAMQRRIEMSLALLGTFVCAVACMLPSSTISVNFPRLLLSKSLSLWITTLYHSQYSFCPCVMLWISSDYWTIVRGIFGRSLKVTPYRPGTAAVAPIMPS